MKPLQTRLAIAKQKNNIQIQKGLKMYETNINKTLNDYKKIMARRRCMTKKSIKRAIKVFCDLGGYQMTQIANLKKYSKHRLIYSGIDLYELESAILQLPDRAIEAVSQYGFNEPYNKHDLEYALEILANTLKLTVSF